MYSILIHCFPVLGIFSEHKEKTCRLEDEKIALPRALVGYAGPDVSNAFCGVRVDEASWNRCDFLLNFDYPLEVRRGEY